MNYISVSQLNTYIKQIFEVEELLLNVSVLGEVSGVSIVRGVAYFSLKDEGAIMPCVCFDLKGYDLKDGEQVIATGSPRFYVKGGRVNFNVVKMQTYGVGALFQKFLELKSKLEKEGLFDPLSKKQLPQNIRRIGVITSPTGAVIRDIITVASRRNPSADIVLCPVKVQGIGAEQEISAAIKILEAQKDIDVIIIARGGGSLEDLQPFNTELLACAIFASSIPTVSAVGHETDFTISDFVASVRAATPSAAAELVTPDKTNEFKQLKNLTMKMKSLASMNFANNYGSFNSCLRLLKQKLNIGIEDYKYNIDNQYLQLKKCVQMNLERKENELNLKINNLNRLNPINLLKSGYAKVYNKNGTVKNVDDTILGENIDIYMQGGRLSANVTDIKRSK